MPNFRMERGHMDRVVDIINLDWAFRSNIYGQGIRVAILDTGITPHPDFVKRRNRIIAFYDAVNGRREMYDDNGHGTHVAGILAGDGCASKGVYTGVAPQCDIVAVKVLNQRGNGEIANVINGLKWVIEHKEQLRIRIVNISVGTTSRIMMNEDSELIHAVNEVWDAGIVVVVAAGNGGPKPKTVGAPGISRKVITVGASDDDIAVDLSGKNMRNYSGRGPTYCCIKKPDIVAPGSNIVSCNVLKRYNNPFGIKIPASAPNYYVTKSGTSMSTPMVSGAVALLLSAHPEMSPKEVKMKIRESCFDMGYPHGRQGWGRLDVKELLESRSNEGLSNGGTNDPIE